MTPPLGTGRIRRMTKRPCRWQETTISASAYSCLFSVVHGRLASNVVLALLSSFFLLWPDLLILPQVSTFDCLGLGDGLYTPLSFFFPRDLTLDLDGCLIYDIQGSRTRFLHLCTSMVLLPGTSDYLCSQMYDVLMVSTVWRFRFPAGVDLFHISPILIEGFFSSCLVSLAVQGLFSMLYSDFHDQCTFYSCFNGFSGFTLCIMQSAVDQYLLSPIVTRFSVGTFPSHRYREL